MWREFLRFLGFVLAGLVLFEAFLLAMFRFDSWDEYQWALRADVVVGFAFAVGVALIAIPPTDPNTHRWRWMWILGLLAWLLMSGGLVSLHYEQYVVRSVSRVGSWQPR